MADAYSRRPAPTNNVIMTDEQYAIQQANNAIGVMSSNIATAAESKKARAWQEKMWHKSNEHSEKMYNKYGTVSAMVAQRMAAGINPMSVTENSSIPSASSVPSSPHVPQYDLNIAGQMLDYELKKAQKENIEAETRKKEIEGSLATDTYDATVRHLNELAESLRLSNRDKSYALSLIRDAYFNEDGTIKDNPNVVSLDYQKLQKEIASNEYMKGKFERMARAYLGVDYSNMPQYLQLEIGEFLVNLMAGQNVDNSILSIRRKAHEYANILKDKDRKQAYDFISYLDEFEAGLDRAIDLANTLKDTELLNILLQSLW